MVSTNKIYADYNATTPLAPEVIEAIGQSMVHHWANPNSSHEHGRDARQVIDEARTSVAKMIGALSNEIIFVSGGTEANCMAIHSALEHYRSLVQQKINTLEKPHVITTLVEHDAIKLHLSKKFAKEVEVSYLPIEDLETEVVENIRPSTFLVTVMLANNETGIILPVAKIARAIERVNKDRKKKGLNRILLHTDAAQAIGKIAVDVQDLNVDYLTVVGHKFYGPRIGALYVRGCPKGAPLYPLFYGGGQERGFRAGTENTPMIAGLGAAAQIVCNNLHQYAKDMSTVRDYLKQQLKGAFGNSVQFNCVDQYDDPEKHLHPNGKKALSLPILPNTCSISFNIEKVSGTEILENCELLLASTGAACNAVEDSMGVLGACGVSSFHAARTIRLSIGRESTSQQMDSIVSDLKMSIKKLLQ